MGGWTSELLSLLLPPALSCCCPRPSWAVGLCEDYMLVLSYHSWLGILDKLIRLWEPLFPSL